MSGSGWRGKLPLRMPSPGLRGAGEFGTAFWVLPELCSWMAEGQGFGLGGGGRSLGGGSLPPSLPCAARKADGEVRFSRLPPGPRSS